MDRFLKRKIAWQYKYDNGLIFNLDCLKFLRAIKDNSVDTVFADPPYNIKKADWDTFKSETDYIKWSRKWIKEASRILKDSGTLYICGFSEILADLKLPAMKYFDRCKWLIWYYDNKANLGNDWGRSHESILCLRKSGEFTFNIDDVRIPYNAHTLKYPVHAQGQTSQYNGRQNNTKHIWQPNPLGAKPKDVISIPTTSNGMAEKTKHPTQKPEALLRKLLLASTNEGDLVVDPFSGSGTTAVVATQLHRNFLVNDMMDLYNSWADDRLHHITERTKSEWIEYDRQIALRRGRLK